MTKILLLLMAAFAGDLTVGEIVDAHESTLGQIREFECQLEKKGENLTPEGSVKKGTWIWSSQWEKERELVDGRKQRPDGWIDGYFEWVYDYSKNGRRTTTYLFHAPPDLQKKLDILNQGPVKGGVIENEINSSRYQSQWAMDLLFRFPYGSSAKMFRDFVAAGKDASVVGEKILEGDRVIQIKVVHGNYPEIENLECQNYSDFFMDPERGFLVRKVVHHMFTSAHRKESSRKRPFVPYIRDVEVVAFKECGNGIFFPVNTAANTYRSESEKNSPIATQAVSVTSLKVNEPITEKVFEVVFPEGLIVYGSPSGKDNRLRARIWGVNNKPEREFRGAEDLKAAMEVQTLGPWYLRWRTMSAFGFCVILLMGVVYLGRRKSFG